MAGFQTEFEFTLPRGYLDDTGKVHKTGTMRLATAADEILPLRDPRVVSNQAYLVILLLSRVITRLGTLPALGVSVIEHLFSADLAYLQDFYRRINETGTSRIPAVCPACQHEFEVEVTSQGGSPATPSTSSTRR
ncbi:MAG: phage tail assembly protein [Chloroflexota bacterium]